MKNSADGEKFLIQLHIYETSGFWKGAFPNWKEDTDMKSFVEVLKQYRDKIILEVTGHDHLSGLRYHEVDDSPGEYFLTKVLFPSVTASSSTQPAFSTFEYDTETGVASNLQYTFIDLQKTIGLPEDTSINEFDWFTVNLEEKFGLEAITGADFAKLVNRMQQDPELARVYEFNRMGVDLEKDYQVQDGLKAYKET